MPSPFERYEDGDIADLIRDYPLAWVAARGADAAPASLLPLLAERDAAGQVTALIGHMARHNPLHGALAADGRALILFQGPQGYVSPTFVSNRSWAPTWNYVQIRIDADLQLEPDGGDAALAALVEAMEEGRPNRWHISDMGPRYGKLVPMIIAFRARVLRLEARFKLGQDERPEVLREILANLSDPALAAWMRRFNPGRC